MKTPIASLDKQRHWTTATLYQHKWIYFVGGYEEGFATPSVQCLHLKNN